MVHAANSCGRHDARGTVHRNALCVPCCYAFSSGRQHRSFASLSRAFAAPRRCSASACICRQTPLWLCSHTPATLAGWSTMLRGYCWLDEAETNSGSHPWSCAPLASATPRNAMQRRVAPNNHCCGPTVAAAALASLARRAASVKLQPPQGLLPHGHRRRPTGITPTRTTRLPPRTDGSGTIATHCTPVNSCIAVRCKVRTEATHLPAWADRPATEAVAANRHLCHACITKRIFRIRQKLNDFSSLR